MFEKRHYELFVKVIHDIEDQYRVAASHAGPHQLETSEISEMLTARLALVFAADNPKFDSFKFNAAVKRRRG